MAKRERESILKTPVYLFDFFRFWIKNVLQFVWYCVDFIQFWLSLPFKIINLIVNKIRNTPQKKSSQEKSGVKEDVVVNRPKPVKQKYIDPKYAGFTLIEEKEGNIKSWEKMVFERESTIGIVVGARGSGKSAFGIKLAENVYAKQKRETYALGFKAETMPSWIHIVEDLEDIPEGSFVLIDEGGILFSSRKAMTNANQLMSELLFISRHKSLSILFIAQNSSNLDVNIIRQADYIVLKPSSLLQKDFERKIIKDIYSSIEDDYDSLKDKKGLAYIYSEVFRGFITNALPSFWNADISKAFKGKSVKKSK